MCRGVEKRTEACCTGILKERVRQEQTGNDHAALGMDVPILHNQRLACLSMVGTQTKAL